MRPSPCMLRVKYDLLDSESNNRAWKENFYLEGVSWEQLQRFFCGSCCSSDLMVMSGYCPSPGLEATAPFLVLTGRHLDSQCHPPPEAFHCQLKNSILKTAGE